MTIKIAMHWMNGTGTYPTMPSVQEIQKYKDTGFNAVMFTEITYHYQMQNFDDILAGRNGWTKTNNPFVTTVRNIQNAGMKAHILMNPNRYTVVHLFINDAIARAKFISHLRYIVEIGVDGIEFEEPTFYGGFAKSNAFFRECRNIVPTTILYGFNEPSDLESSLTYESIDWITINNEKLFDFVQPQPASTGSPNYLMPDSRVEDDYNTFHLLFPNIITLPQVFVNYSTAIGNKHNMDLVSNISLVINKGWDFNAWFADSITSNEHVQLKAVMSSPDTCPTPQYNYTITQE